MIEPIINAPTFQLPLIMVAGMILPLILGFATYLTGSRQMGDGYIYVHIYI